MSILRPRLRSLKNALKRTFHRLLPKWLLGALVRRTLPRTATLEVTTACGLRCPLCPTHIRERSSRFMKRSHLLDVLDACASRLRWVSFHMQGEPLAHRELMDFVRTCSSRGIDTGFSTNGMLLGRNRDALLDSDLGFVSIAIDGCDATDYAKYRQGGDFDVVVASTRDLIAERNRRGLTRPVIQLQTIMFPYNEAREEEVVAFLESFGSDEIRLKRPSYCAEGGGYEVPKNAHEFLELVGGERDDLHYARSVVPEGELFRNRRLCPQLERTAVLSDGRVVACCMDSTGETAFGDLGQESFKEIWQGPRHQRLLEDFFTRRLGLCRFCDLS
jgi:MoaA/NifB/PqqE/SkfB family radical SAM enzyme